MANEERLMELLRRAHTVIGEGLIENALDERDDLCPRPLPVRRILNPVL